MRGFLCNWCRYLKYCVRIEKYRHKPINLVSCTTFSPHSAGFKIWVLLTIYSDFEAIFGFGAGFDKLNTQSLHMWGCFNYFPVDSCGSAHLTWCKCQRLLCHLVMTWLILILILLYQDILKTQDLSFRTRSILRRITVSGLASPCFSTTTSG